MNVQTLVVSLVALTPAPALAQPRDAQDRCARLMRAAYRSEQVERPAERRPDSSVPQGWREVTAPLPAAQGIDSLVSRTFGLTAKHARQATPFPPRWVAFVVDSTGRVPACSVRAYDIALSAADLARAVARWRFIPAEVGGRRVNQVVLMAVPR